MYTGGTDGVDDEKLTRVRRVPEASQLRQDEVTGNVSRVFKSFCNHHLYTFTRLHL